MVASLLDMLPSLLALLTAITVVQSPRVQVTRREVTVIFPRHATPVSGWRVPVGADEWTQYGWWITYPPSPRSDFAGRPTFVAFEVRQDSTRARIYTSLETVVADVRTSRCAGGMLRLCFLTPWHASVQDGRVVLRLADSATIAEEFGRRPRTLRLSRHLPPDSAWAMDVAIEYRDPPLVTTVDSLTPTRTRRDDVRRRNWIVGGDFWLAVGDSQEVTLDGSTCTADGCGWGNSMGVGTFRVRNPRIAVLRPRAAYRRLARLHGELEARTIESPVQLFALAPGTTTIVFHERERPPLDETGARRSLRTLEQTVHVTTPLRGIRIVPPARIAAHRELRYPVVAIDREGRPHSGVEPETFDVISGPGHTVIGNGTIVFYGPGQATVVATFRSFADTVQVVVDSSAPPE